MIELHFIVLSSIVIDGYTREAHAVIKISGLRILGRRQVGGFHVTITIQPHQVKHSLEKSLLNTLAQDAATKQ